MGPKLSIALYRLIGGERGKTLSWGIATHKDRNMAVRAVYGLWPAHFDESLDMTELDYVPKYEQGWPLDKFPKAEQSLKAWQSEQGILSDGKYGNESHWTMWDYLKLLRDKLQEADAKIMELTVRLQEMEWDSNPVFSEPEGFSGYALLAMAAVGAVIGFLGGMAF